MLVDYQSLVLNSYKRKLATDDLSPLLKQPSPANLRDECIAMCKAGYVPKDERALRAFFGKHGDKAEYLEAIDHFDINKFKALQKFLLGESNSTDIKNIELLAWLIDFPERPFVYGKSYRIEGTVEPTIRPTEPEVDNTIEPPSLPNSQSMAATPPDDTKVATKKIIKFGTRQTLAATTVLVGISMAFWFGNTKGDGGCMYWEIDHYQPIACNQQPNKANAFIIPLDTVKVKYFKKIMLPDTIMRRSIGAIWYSKINNVVEFYTAAGYHPVEIDRRLKPLSEYMYGKYIQRKEPSQ
jgi:hypothetical protein